MSRGKPTFYESENDLNQYLLFHYGEEADFTPFKVCPQIALNFPLRCVSECLDKSGLPTNARALDLGCAVGRSSFELSKYCSEVTAIDKSHLFISAAKEIQTKGSLKYTIKEEGTKTGIRVARLPEHTRTNVVTFIQGDGMNFFDKFQPFEVVLAANLICRLEDPESFLRKIHTLVVPQGQLILTSPYSWQEEYTPVSAWIKSGVQGPLETLQGLLKDHFILEKHFDMPFLLREHYRKYQLGISQASIWKKN